MLVFFKSTLFHPTQSTLGTTLPDILASSHPIWYPFCYESPLIFIYVMLSMGHKAAAWKVLFKKSIFKS